MPESSPLFGKDVIKRIKLCEREWEEEYLQPQGEATEETYLTSSKKPIKCLYSPADTEQFDYLRDLGFPGTEPFIRGIHPTIYRGRPFVFHSL
ncbi:MAG: methylmalonyl-CoA mutase family protein [Thermodesulfobacteriota bacterium]